MSFFHRSNAFNDSKSRHSSTITSQHSEDEEDYVLDIDVDMGAESTYDDDGYRDESDDQSSNITSKMTPKSHVPSVIELDSSPEKSPRKQLSRGNPVQLPFSEESKLEQKEDKTPIIETNSSEKPKEDVQVNEAVDDTLVPTEKEDVPIDEKNDVLDKPTSSYEIPTEQDKKIKLPSTSSENDSKLPNEDNKIQIENSTNDTKPTENMDFSTEDVAINSPKSDLKEPTGKEEELKTTRVNKRRRSSSCSLQDDETASNSNNTIKTQNQEEGLPAKKLKAELDTIFPKHNQVLTDYINKTSNETVDNIQCHINQLLVEINTLNDMIKTNENEWNNMIYLKKMKEEICIRLTRKKQTIQLESKKIGDISALLNDLASDETLKNDDIEKQRGPQLSSTPLNNKNSSAVNQNLSEQVSKILDGFENSSKSFSQSAANMIIQNRANMKSSELAKEKLNMQKVHR